MENNELHAPRKSEEYNFILRQHVQEGLIMVSVCPPNDNKEDKLFFHLQKVRILIKPKIVRRIVKLTDSVRTFQARDAGFAC